MSEYDTEHLMSCIDPHCCYCNDTEPARPTVVSELLKFAALPEGYKIKTRAPRKAA